MEQLLWTPEELSAQNILPYSPRTIYKLVQDGRIRVNRQKGEKLVIHKAAIEEFANQFLCAENAPAAGPHVHKENGTCRKSKKASLRGVGRKKSGRGTPGQTENRLDALLESGPMHQTH